MVHDVRRRLSTFSDAPVGRHRMPDRNFRLWLVFPAVLLLLLIGLFPLDLFAGRSASRT